MGKKMSPEAAAKTSEALQSQLDAQEQAARSHQSYVTGLKELADVAESNAKHAETNIANVKAQTEADQKLTIEGGARIQALQDELKSLQETNAAIQAANTRAAASHVATEAARSPAGQAAAQATAADAASRAAAAGERGPQGQIDLGDTVTAARLLEARLRNQRPGDRSQGDLTELHRLFERMLGFAESVDPHIRQTAHSYQDLNRRMSLLESREQRRIAMY